MSLPHTERDAFDTLFDHAPDKLNVVKKVTLPKSLDFINRRNNVKLF